MRDSGVSNSNSRTSLSARKTRRTWGAFSRRSSISSHRDLIAHDPSSTTTAGRCRAVVFFTVPTTGSPPSSHAFQTVEMSCRDTRIALVMSGNSEPGMRASSLFLPSRVRLMAAVAGRPVLKSPVREARKSRYEISCCRPVTRENTELRFDPARL